MAFMPAPYMAASFYWHDMAEHLSLQRACAYLIQRGMTTLECGEDVEPDSALLRLLLSPTSDIAEAKFITSDRLPPQGKQTRRPPGRIIVHYDYISGDALSHGDHRSVDIEWSAAPVSGPGWTLSKKEAEQLAQFTRKDYYFFIDACTLLDPLYANFGFEADGLMPCLYDYIYRQSHVSWRSNGPCYLRDGILSAAESETLTSNFIYVKKLPNGTFFTDNPWMTPRQKYSDDLNPLPKSARRPTRDIVTPALRRFRRSQI